MNYITLLRNLGPFIGKYRFIVVVSLLLTFLGAGLAQITPLTTRYLVDQVTASDMVESTRNDIWSPIMLGLLILLAKEVVTLVTNFGTRFLGENLKAKVGTDLANAVFQKLLALDMTFYDDEKNDVGMLTKRIDRGIESLAKTVKNFLSDILPLLFNAVAALIVMYSVNFVVGVVSSFIIPVYFWFSITQAKRQKGIRTQIQDVHEQRTSATFSALSAIKLVQSFTREEYELERYGKISNELAGVEIKHHLVNHIFDTFKLFFEQIGAVAIILITSFLVLSGEMSVGAIMLHLLLYNNITAPIRHLHRIYDEANEALIYAGGFFAILATNSSLSNGSSQNYRSTSETDPFIGDIVLKDVEFSYTTSRKTITNVSLRVPAGKTIAFVGLSGAGKTTLANLIGRFYDPNSGCITVGSVDLRNLATENIRSNMGFVLQHNHIFNGTIADNIRYGKLNATDSEVVTAAKSAGLHEDILRLPSQYASSATRLSGGQMQRIAIARVFLKDPPILVLDEPTASLDAITAGHIQESLASIRKNRTVVVISHNVASIVDADQIYVIKDGQIIGEGSHQSLYNANPHYRSIIDADIVNSRMEQLIAVRNSVLSKPD